MREYLNFHNKIQGLQGIDYIRLIQIETNVRMGTLAGGQKTFFLVERSVFFPLLLPQKRSALTKTNKILVLE
jgi:hypothetical protein